MVTKWAGGLEQGSWINHPFHQVGRSWLEESRVVPSWPCTCMCLSDATGLRQSRICPRILSCSKRTLREAGERVKRSCWCLHSHLLMCAFLPHFSSKDNLFTLRNYPSLSPRKGYVAQACPIMILYCPLLGTWPKLGHPRPETQFKNLPLNCQKREAFFLSFSFSFFIEVTSQVVLVVKNRPANAGDIRDTSSISGSGRSPGGGHGNPLQYSCLENPMDRGACWPRVPRVTKSWTWLKWLSVS